MITTARIQARGRTGGVTRAPAPIVVTIHLPVVDLSLACSTTAIAEQTLRPPTRQSCPRTPWAQTAATSRVRPASRNRGGARREGVDRDAEDRTQPQPDVPRPLRGYLPSHGFPPPPPPKEPPAQS